VDFKWTGQREKPDGPEQDREFERELKQAMERRPAPPSLKRRIMQNRSARRTERHHTTMIWWQRLAASFLIAGVIAGGFGWRQIEERRKGEEAKQQVLTALRITNQVLNNMNRKLVEHDRAESGK
jgi:plasmid stabilization system protein ParE